MALKVVGAGLGLGGDECRPEYFERVITWDMGTVLPGYDERPNVRGVVRIVEGFAIARYHVSWNPSDFVILSMRL